MNTAQISLSTPGHIEISTENPKIFAASRVLQIRPASLVRHINTALDSPISRDLYVSLEIGEMGLSPQKFRDIMFVFLGREPGPQDLTSVADKRHRHVATSSATRLLDEYLDGVLSVLFDAREADIDIGHLHAAWLVIQFGEHASRKLDELVAEHGSSRNLRAAMAPHMRATANFERMI